MNTLKLQTPVAWPEERATDEQVGSAFEILHYNQNLVQFADGKANTLILINSIALASIFSATAVVPPEFRPFAMVLRVSFLLACVASIGLCLLVVLSRIEPQRHVHADLVFFADILSRPSSSAYRIDFLRTDAPSFLDELIDRNYRVAAIASRKFRYYGVAQHATVWASALWILYIAFIQSFV